MSQFPPFPPNRPYSPSQAYGDFPPPSAHSQGPPPGREYAPYSSYSHPPPAPYQPYEPYGTPDSASNHNNSYAYDQPGQRRPYESDSYDPYQPSSANSYDPGAPQMRGPPPPTLPPFPPPRAGLPPPPQSAYRRPSPPVVHRPASLPQRYEPAPSRESHDLGLLTEATTITLAGQTIAVHALPASHLPIEKYIAMNKDDALNVHRQLCIGSTSVWYTDGASRAGEGWSSAVEWLIDSGRSGSKMRGCVNAEGVVHTDALDSEIGGIVKAIEGYQELLHQAIKNGKPIGQHDLIVFCNSPAAIVSLDTSSRAESIRFEKLWKSICTEFLFANLKLAWLPKGSGLEGQVLADKIATVGASNSYLKRKKENTLLERYSRAGGGEPMAGGSSEAGPWQRGDADPSRRKSPFERPRPLSPVPEPRDLETVSASANGEDALQLDVSANDQAQEFEEESAQPKEGAIFVTHFPDEISAKDIGMLFNQYGDILSVDIYHISPAHPRFAFVAYERSTDGLNAIASLDRRPIDLTTPFAQQHAEDLQVWSKWGGQITVVKAEPPRLVPSSVLQDFPNLPEWAHGGGGRDSKSSHTAASSPHPPQEAEQATRKRDRPETSARPASSSPAPESPSPHKRPRPDHLPAKPGTLPVPQAIPPQGGNPAPSIKTEPVNLTNGNLPPNPYPNPPSNAGKPNNDPHNPYAMPPFPPTLKAGESDSAAKPTGSPKVDTQVNTQARSSAALPPTPNTAERPTPLKQTDALPSPARALSLDPTSQGTVAGGPGGTGKRPLTNSAAEPQEYPIRVGVKTLRSQIQMVRQSFVKVDAKNWIAHSCFIAVDLDRARRALQEDLYATDTAFINGRELEKTLLARGYTPQRVDTFINKVLKVLDGIASAEEEEAKDSDGANGDKSSEEDVSALHKELEEALAKYPDQTKEAVASGSTLLEYILRGKEAQDKKRLEIERRVKVLEGMVKIGEAVSGVVRFLLTEDKA